MKQTHLGILGINTSGNPTSKLPKAFNPEAHKLWLEVLNSDEYKTVKAKDSSVRWDKAITVFMGKCRESKLSPFYTPENQIQNNKFSVSLSKSRSVLSNFLNSTKLVNVFSIQKLDRKYLFKEGSTVIMATATMRKLEDPTLTAYLKEVGFVRHAEDGASVWKFSPQANVDIVVNMSRASAPKITYIITVHPALVYSSTKETRIPTKEKLTKLLEKEFLFPVLKKYPIKNLNRIF